MEKRKDNERETERERWRENYQMSINTQKGDTNTKVTWYKQQDKHCIKTRDVVGMLT